MNPLTFATHLAKGAGDILRQHFRQHGALASLKADRTVVTEADFQSDQWIRKAIRETFPQDGILSEEEETRFPTEREFVWVIDPLDGTANFSLGLHHWGVSIARLKNGYPHLAAIYFPLLDELFLASEGGGAFLNGSPLQVDPNSPDNPVSCFCCCSRTYRRYNISIRYKTRILGSAAYGLCTVAHGSATFAFEATPKVWDFAGSWLVTQEASGVIAPIKGPPPFPLIPGQNYDAICFPLLVAPTQELWAKGCQQIKKK